MHTTINTPFDGRGGSGKNGTLSPTSPAPKPEPVSDDSSTLEQRFRWYIELTRLHKFPLGNILIIWPCLWGLTMAAYKSGLPGREFVVQALIFTLGSTVLHSTACVINDICDVEFDRQVERTKSRPLASGRIPISGACVLCGAMTACCGVFLHFARPLAASVGWLALFPLHALYPLMKRWTYWPQAWLGLAMNWGFLVAWLNVVPNSTGTDCYIMAIMLLGATCWTIVYDTEYACQDREDDSKVGLKSTALLFGDHVRPILAAFAVAFVLCLVLVGSMNGQTAIYYVISCGGGASHLIWQFRTWDVNDVEDCGRKFESNGGMGAFVFIGILCDYLLKV